MKLGEAKNLLIQMGFQQSGCELRLCSGPKDKISESLDEISDLVKKRQFLKKRIEETEAVTAIGESALAEILSALVTLEEKIRVLEMLSVRKDLEPSQQEGIKQQLLTYRSTRDTLRTGVEKCNWETDLLDE